MGIEHDGVGGLSGGHIVGGLLQLHYLLVGKQGAVVNESHAVERLAVGAHCRLSNPATIHAHCLAIMTDIAAEEG